MAERDKERIITANCPECDSELTLRLPPDRLKGEFSFTCDDCGTEQNVTVGPKGIRRFRTVKKRKEEVKQAREVLPPEGRRTRLRVSATLLVIAGILGLAFSINNVTGAFTIKDIEEQTRGETTTLTISVFDSTSGRPVTDARITLSGPGGNHSGFTDPAGLSVIQGVHPGVSDITLSKEGYKTVRSEITLRKGTPNVLDVPMETGNSTETIPLRATQFVTKDYSTLVTNVLAMLMFMTSVIAFVSAYFTYKGEFYALSLVGAFLSILSFGFVLGSVLSLVATVLITFSYDEFSHTHVLKKLLEASRRGDLIGRLRR